MPRQTGIDDLDARLIALFTEQPHVGVLGASRTLGVARGTVQARLDRLARAGRGAGGRERRATAKLIDRLQLGLDPALVLQHQLGQIRYAVRAIPEVLEIHSITGVGDLIVRIVARDNADLGRVIDEIIDDTHVLRANTAICLVTHLDHRTGPLVEAAARSRDD